MGRKISDICLKQGQGMRGRAAPPQPGIHRVPPPPPGGKRYRYLSLLILAVRAFPLKYIRICVHTHVF